MKILKLFYLSLLFLLAISNAQIINVRGNVSHVSNCTQLVRLYGVITIL